MYPVCVIARGARTPWASCFGPAVFDAVEGCATPSSTTTMKAAS